MTSLLERSLVGQETFQSGAPTRPIGILGTGLAVPGDKVTNHDLCQYLDTSDEWIVKRTGIQVRNYLEPGRTTSDLCIEAAREALRRSGIAAADLDAVIISTVTPDQPLPSTALIIADAIGAHRALPLDLVQAGCAGGALGIITGVSMLQHNGLRNIMVIGADVLSRLTDPTDRTTRVFFGDAAGAVVLGEVPSGHGVLSWDFGTALSYSVQVEAGGATMPVDQFVVDHRKQYLQMDGRVVWEQATEKLPRSIRAALGIAGFTVDQIAYFAMHQANLNIINAVLADLGVSPDRAGVTVDHLGNTGSASVFTVLHQAATSSLRRGDLAVVSSVGAGFMWGSIVLRHH